MIYKRSSTEKTFIRNDEQRLVEGIIYAPYQLDTYGTMMLPADIAKMHYDFNTQRMYSAIDHEHNETSSGCEMLRNWIAGANDPDGYPEGAWIGMAKIHNDILWDKVKRGEINGYSIHCYAGEVKFSGMVNQVISASGSTESASNTIIMPNHEHGISLVFRSDGSVQATQTSEVLGHSHKVFYATSTETVFDHSHPLKIKGN